MSKGFLVSRSSWPQLLRFLGVGILVAATPDRAEDLVGGAAGDMAVLSATQFQLVGPVLADGLAQGRLGFRFLQAHRFSPPPYARHRTNRHAADFPKSSA